MHAVFGFQAIDFFSAFALAAAVAAPAGAAVIKLDFAGGPAGSTQELSTAFTGFDFLAGVPIGVTDTVIVNGQTTMTGSLTLDTRNFLNDLGPPPRRSFQGQPPPIISMAMSADGPLFPHALATDNSTSARVELQWADGSGGRDFLHALSGITFIDDATVTSTGGNGEPLEIVHHTHTEGRSLFLYMDGLDGFLTEVVVDGGFAPLVEGMQGCVVCFIDILEFTQDVFFVNRFDAEGNEVAAFRFYDNVLTRRSTANLIGIASKLIEAPVEVDEPATLGLGSLGVIAALWARCRARQGRRRERISSTA